MNNRNTIHLAVCFLLIVLLCASANAQKLTWTSKLVMWSGIVADGIASGRSCGTEANGIFRCPKGQFLAGR